jgi:hypothetical protein
MLAITYTKITKIKVAEWGTPKKYYIKKGIVFIAGFEPITFQPSALTTRPWLLAKN